MPIKKIMLYGGIFIAGFVAVSLWSFWLVIRPPKIYSHLTPEQAGMPYENLRFRTDDNKEIAAWYIENKNRRAGAPVIVFLHGYPAEKGDLIFIAKDFWEDFDLLLIDFRSFGESSGRITTIGKKEPLDLKATLDELERLGKTKIGVFGFSLGGAVAIKEAALDRRIDAVISYAAFANLKKLGYESYKILFVFKYPLVELLSLWARIFLKYDVSAESPAEAARDVRIPVLLIHSRIDEQIPFWHAEYLSKALSKNTGAEFYFLENATHGELPSDFASRAKDFFLRAFAK